MTAFLVDMDGVLYRGEQVLPGALEFFECLSSVPHLFITNNSSRSPASIVRELSAMGLNGIEASQILTSAQATAAWLAGQKPGFRYFAVGGQGLHEALAAMGTEDRSAADCVVVGEGAGLNYESLTDGINLILSQEAMLVATNPDDNVNGWRDGKPVVLPGGGALVAPFEVATGRKAVVIGKPQPLLYEMAMKRLDVEAAECIMVGDRPDTDIAGAARLGMKTALVRTGRFPPGAPWPPQLAKPDWDVNDLPEFMDVLAAGCLMGASNNCHTGAGQYP